MQVLRVAAVLALIVAACSGAPAGSPSPQGSAANPSGSSGAGLRLVSVGDSIPYGQQDCDDCEAFPALFGASIQETTGVAVEVDNLSQHDGNTAARFVEELKGEAHKPTREALAAADIVIVTIGHNDVPWGALDDTCDADHGFFDGNESAPWDVLVGPCLQTEAERYRKNLDGILTQIVDLREGRPTVYRFTNQYNDIPGDRCCPPEAIAVSKTTKDTFNKVACEVAEAHGFICIELYHAFNGSNGDEDAGDLLAPDHTHPSAKGHELIAQLLIDAGLAPLR
jgi:lysophospholipase L1-like esterase